MFQFAGVIRTGRRENARICVVHSDLWRAIQVPMFHSCNKRLEQAFHFQPRQMHAHAGVNPVAEPDMLARVAGDVEAVGVLEHRGIAIRRGIDHHRA